MRTLDRYIVRNFLSSAGLWFAVLMVLRILTDLFVNMDEFAKQGLPIGQLLQVIGSYYAHHCLVYFTELGGIIIVASATFTFAMMNKTNELTAMLASGVSLHRVIWPVAVCSLIVSGLVVVDRELVIPRPEIREKLARDRGDPQGVQVLTVSMLTDGRNSVWYAPKFNPAEEEMDNPAVILRDASLRLTGTICGKSARPAELDGRRGWRFQDGRLLRPRSATVVWEFVPRPDRIYTRVDPEYIDSLAGEIPAGSTLVGLNDLDANDPALGLQVRARKYHADLPDPNDPLRFRSGTLDEPRFVYRDEQGAVLGIYAARRARWVYDPDNNRGCWRLDDGYLFYPSDLRTDDVLLRQSGRWLDYMSSMEISRLLALDRVPDRAAAVLTRHIRFTEPLNNLIMLLLGLPFILSRERNLRASASLCVLVVLTFYAFIYMSRQMGLPPELAAWLPILLFGPVAAVMVDTVKT